MFILRNTPCMFNKTVCKEVKALFNCQRSINVFHCIKNERNRSGAICIQPFWVQQGVLDWVFLIFWILKKVTKRK